MSCGARSRNFARVRDRVHRTEDDPILGDSMDDIEDKKVREWSHFLNQFAVERIYIYWSF